MGMCGPRTGAFDDGGTATAVSAVVLVVVVNPKDLCLETKASQTFHPDSASKTKQAREIIKAK